MLCAVRNSRGSITTTGRSEAIRSDKALFRSHPEFRQRARVRAQVIGPGSLLVTLDSFDVTAEPDVFERDPVVAAYLAFRERDMSEHPETVEPFTESELARLEALTAGVEVSDDDVLVMP